MAIVLITWSIIGSRRATLRQNTVVQRSRLACQRLHCRMSGKYLQRCQSRGQEVTCHFFGDMQQGNCAGPWSRLALSWAGSVALAENPVRDGRALQRLTTSSAATS